METEREARARAAADLPLARRIFCNRTLNLNRIRAVGYDMDYTLIHYHVDRWEQRAFEYLRQNLVDLGWPVEDLRFQPGSKIRGLTFDLELGNIVKADQFGYVVRAFHGTRRLAHEEQRRCYALTVVDPKRDRFVFLHTLFAISEANMYAQLVDLLDAGRLPGVMGYEALYRAIRRALDRAHAEGRLKAEIIADPDPYVDLDPDLPLTLLDQRAAGKKLLLITNSEWEYTAAMMAYAFDRFLPQGQSWRDLFDVILVASRKPSFFHDPNPLFKVEEPSGLLRPCPSGMTAPGIYWGGCARHVEEYLGLSGDQILYVGDHIYGDIYASKSEMSWRSALVLRELESDLEAIESFHGRREILEALITEREQLEEEYRLRRLLILRARQRYGPSPGRRLNGIHREMNGLRAKMKELDGRLVPLLEEAGKLSNPHWGMLMRAGNNKSLLARQVERYADIYMSRVSNFLHYTPFAYLRSHRGSLPHDGR
jgi:HAD superfamily 5'-nucleotidase-like hydrolase